MNTALVDLLIEARRSGRPIDLPPAQASPRDVAEAYRQADDLVSRLGRSVVGWKVGATSLRAQEILGVKEPFYGRVLSGTLYRSPARLDAGGPFGVEIEVAFRIGRDLPPGRADYGVESIAAEIDAAFPALELNRPSFAKPFEISPLFLIADNGVNAGLVIGDPIPLVRLAEVAAAPCRASLNGAPAGEGNSSAVLGHPLAAVAWLANTRARAGAPLRKGDVITSRNIIGRVRAGPGDVVKGEFDTLGSVRLEMAG
jgi:2-keto-4-pentenoate hydratase